MFLKFDSDWYEPDLAFCNSMTEIGKIGESFVSIYGSVDAEIQKLITAARPVGNWFFVLGPGTVQSIIAGYAVRHEFPIIQLHCKGRKQSIYELKDDPEDTKKARLCASRIVDIARKYYCNFEKISPKKNVLQD